MDVIVQPIHLRHIVDDAGWLGLRAVPSASGLRHWPRTIRPPGNGCRSPDHAAHPRHNAQHAPSSATGFPRPISRRETPENYGSWGLAMRGSIRHRSPDCGGENAPDRSTRSGPPGPPPTIRQSRSASLCDMLLICFPPDQLSADPAERVKSFARLKAIPVRKR